MEIEATYRLDVALTGADDSRRFVIVTGDDRLHKPATDWLGFLQDCGKSPNTVEKYGSRVAWYLSWTALRADWRAIGVAHLAMWKRTVAMTPYRKSNGDEAMRKPSTVDAWMMPVRSFYEWADSQPARLLTSDVAARMTELRYFAPGTSAGGEHGRTRRVLIDELRFSDRAAGTEEPQWIDDPGARERLELLELNARDRFLIDLLYFTGVRMGEAMSLFVKDMHLGGGSKALGCPTVDPHLHVVLDNPVENRSRSKGKARTLIVPPIIVEGYIDYILERERILGDGDTCPHVFVNLYTHGERRGRAMTDKGTQKLIARVGRRIGFDLTGPHMLRHTLATRLIRGIECEKHPEDVVGAILGHRSASSTRVYTHDIERAKKEALAATTPRTIRLGVI